MFYKTAFLFPMSLLVFSQVTIFQIEDGKTKVGEKKLREFLRREKIDISHIRCIIVGCARAGKTTFLRRLENTPFAKLKNEVKSTEMATLTCLRCTMPAKREKPLKVNSLV